MTETVREPCPHCHRRIVVIGKAGQLARHNCVDSPATMTPDQRVKVCRNNESRTRRTRVVAVRRARWSRAGYAWWLAFAAVLAESGHVAVGLLSEGDDISRTSLVFLVVCLFGLRLAWLAAANATHDVDYRRRNAREAVTAHNEAFTHLLEMEGELGDDAWPELALTRYLVDLPLPALSPRMTQTDTEEH